LEAQAEFIAGTAEAVSTGQISLEDAKSATENLDEVDSTVAAGPIDPNVILLNKLKNLIDSPELKKSLELFKESVTTVDKLVKSLPEGERSAFLADMLVDPSFFEKVIDVYSLNPSLPPILFEELLKLNLSETEMDTIFADVVSGPGDETPADDPPPNSSLTLTEEVNLLHLLQDYTGERELTPTSLDASLFISSEQIVASAFFDDVVQTFDALSELDKNNQEYLPSEQEILDSLDSASNQDIGSNLDTSSSDDPFNSMQVFGGRSVSLGEGSYTLGLDNYSIAASEQLNLLGEIVFNGKEADELILLSAGAIDMSELVSFTHPGSLGFGSFDSMQVEDVSLTAGDINIRSLDSIVLKNSSLETRPAGADFVHLLAYNQIDAENLSLNTRKIIMSAMTINLTNITFPDGSDVNLKSLYGPDNGKYPIFGESKYGRVNFIRDVRYGSQLLNSVSSFDAHGNRIIIGSL